MAETSDHETLRKTIAQFDELQTKIAGGMLAVMFKQPKLVKDRKWLTDQFCEIVLATEELESEETGQAYIKSEIQTILDACFSVFLKVGEDLEPRISEGLTTFDAVAHARTFFPEAQN